MPENNSISIRSSRSSRLTGNICEDKTILADTSPPQVFSLADYWLTGVQRCRSPFCNQRPDGAEISLLVIHCISLPEGEFGTDYVRQLFLGELQEYGPCSESAQLQVSAHLFIRRGGKVIQFVPFNLRAWHAGKSSFAGVPDCNDYSIGIELEGTIGSHFTQAQYTTLSGVTNALIRAYPGLRPECIVGHSDVALPQGRKNDPGSGMDWSRYFAALDFSTIG